MRVGVENLALLSLVLGVSCTYGDSSSTDVVDDWCSTGYHTVAQLTYKWAVNNFSIRAEKKGEDVESPTFSSSSPDGSRWYLSLYPRGHRDTNGEVISLFLCLRGHPLEEFPRPVITQFKLSIEPSEGTLVTKDNEGRAFTQSQNCWGWYSFSQREELFNKASRSILPFSFFMSREEDKDVITVVANIRVMEQKSTCVGGRASQPPSLNHQMQGTEVSSDVVPPEECPFLNALLQSGNWSDLTIYAGRDSFAVHRAVLASRSPELWQALEEELDGRLAILSGITAEAMEQILRYVYTGKPPTEYLQETLQAAERFGMRNLVSLCLKKLESSMSKNNVIRYLVLAHKSSSRDSSLMNKAWDLLESNVEELMRTSDWVLLQENPDILSQLLLRKTQSCTPPPDS